MTAADLAALDDDGGLPGPTEVPAPVDAATALARVIETCRADLARLVDRHDAAVELAAMTPDLAAALGRDLLDPDDLLASARAVDALTEARVRALLARITNGDPTP